jgi:hypothetical protein
MSKPSAPVCTDFGWLRPLPGESPRQTFERAHNLFLDGRDEEFVPHEVAMREVSPPLTAGD